MTTTTTARRLSALASPAVLALSLGLALTACGGGAGGAPTDASKKDFCQAYQAEPDLGEALADAPPEEQATAIKDALDQLADDFEKVGTPKDIPDDAREGFEVSLDAAKDISKDDIKTAIEKKDAGFFDNVVSGDDKKKADAFDEWAKGYC